MEKRTRSWRRGGRRALLGTLAALVGAAGLTACAVPDPVLPQYPPVGPVRVATSEVIGHEVVTDIYGLALRRAGALVQFGEPGGTTEDAYGRVVSQESNFTTGYTGVIAAEADGAAGAATSSEAVFEEMESALPDGLVAGPMAKAQDKPGLFVSQHTRDTLGIARMSDLAGKCGTLRLGASSANATDEDLRRALRGYDCAFADVTTRFSSPYDVREAVRGGTIGTGAAYSTDPVLFPGDMVFLDDDRELVRAQNLVPVFAEGLLGDEQMAALRKVSTKLTTREVVSLNAAVESGRTPPIVAASGWLNANGFDTPLDSG